MVTNNSISHFLYAKLFASEFRITFIELLALRGKRWEHFDMLLSSVHENGNDWHFLTIPNVRTMGVSQKPVQHIEAETK